MFSRWYHYLNLPRVSRSPHILVWCFYKLMDAQCAGFAQWAVNTICRGGIARNQTIDDEVHVYVLSRRDVATSFVLWCNSRVSERDIMIGYDSFKVPGWILTVRVAQSDTSQRVFIVVRAKLDGYKLRFGWKWCTTMLAINTYGTIQYVWCI